MNIFFLLKIIVLFLLNESKLIIKNINFFILFLSQNNFYKYLIHKKRDYNILRDSKKKKNFR